MKRHRWNSRLPLARGPKIVADLEGLGPLLRDRDVVVFGRRDANEAAENGSQRIEDTEIRILDLAEVCRLGAVQAAAEAVDQLAASCRKGFWIHLDADVLDDAIMPAVDYRMSGGFT